MCYDCIGIRIVQANVIYRKFYMLHLFIVNPKSFPDKRQMKSFIESVPELVGERATVLVSRYPRDAILKVHNFLKNAAANGEKARVYAVGGDGILFDCLNGMVEFPENELASIPYGNANDFLRAFGKENVPLFRDIKKISESPSVMTDVFRCNENIAVSIASVGLEGSAILVTESIAKKLSGFKLLRRLIPTLYTIGALIVLCNERLRSQYYFITVDGVDYSGEYVDINIGNSFGNGGKNASNPFAVPNDGYLNAIFVKKMSFFKCLMYMGQFTKGNFDKFSRGFIHVKFKEMTATSEDPIRICADGEAFYARKLDIAIRPNALRVIAPEGVTYKPFREYVEDTTRRYY
jgi:diacylglycerol kinase family enzyme